MNTLALDPFERKYVLMRNEEQRSDRPIGGDLTTFTEDWPGQESHPAQAVLARAFEAMPSSSSGIVWVALPPLNAPANGDVR